MRTLEEDNNSGSKALNEDELLGDEKLVSSVEDRLAGVKDDDGVEDDDQTTDDSDDRDESTPDNDDDQADDDGDDDDSTSDDKESDDDKDDKKDEPKLPEAYLRCAVHQGWKKEEALELFGQSPELALKTFSNIYQSTNKLSEHWAAAGRTAKEQARKDAEVPAKEDDSDSIETILGDVENLDPNVVAVLKAMDAKTKKLEGVINKLSTSPSVDIEYERAKAHTDNTKSNAFNQFFQSESMKPYEKCYGVLEPHQKPRDLTLTQQEYRWTVLEKADEMMAGAHLQGRELSAEDALEAAHLLVTEPIREQVIVDKLKSTAKKRKKSHLLRPSESRKQSKATASEKNGKPANREEVLERAGQRLAKIF